MMAGMTQEEMAAAGRLLASKRQRFTVTCEECGTEFSAVDKRARYCSDRCNMRAWRKAHPDARKKIPPSAQPSADTG